jgi:hypothetical protein
MDDPFPLAPCHESKAKGTVFVRVCLHGNWHAHSDRGKKGAKPGKGAAGLPSLDNRDKPSLQLGSKATQLILVPSLRRER